MAHAPSFVESGQLRIQVAISDLSLHQGSRAASEARGSPYFPSGFVLILSADPSLLSLGPPGPLPAQCHRIWEQPLNATKTRSGLEVISGKGCPTSQASCCPSASVSTMTCCTDGLCRSCQPSVPNFIAKMHQPLYCLSRQTLQLVIILSSLLTIPCALWALRDSGLCIHESGKGALGDRGHMPQTLSQIAFFCEKKNLGSLAQRTRAGAQSTQ